MCLLFNSSCLRFSEVQKNQFLAGRQHLAPKVYHHWIVSARPRGESKNYSGIRQKWSRHVLVVFSIWILSANQLQWYVTYRCSWMGDSSTFNARTMLIPSLASVCKIIWKMAKDRCHSLIMDIRCSRLSQKPLHHLASMLAQTFSLSMSFFNAHKRTTSSQRNSSRQS